MSDQVPLPMDRRDFLKLAGIAAVASAADTALAAPAGKVCVVLDEADVATTSAPVKWAAERLRQELAKKGVEVESAAEGEIVVKKLVESGVPIGGVDGDVVRSAGEKAECAGELVGGKVEDGGFMGGVEGEGVVVKIA